MKGRDSETPLSFHNSGKAAAWFTIRRQRHDTGIATRDPATVSTHQGPGITFPIEEEEDLGMVLEGVVHCPDECVAEENSRRFVAEVNETNRRLMSNFLWHVMGSQLRYRTSIQGMDEPMPVQWSARSLSALKLATSLA